MLIINKANEIFFILGLLHFFDFFQKVKKQKSLPDVMSGRLYFGAFLLIFPGGGFIKQYPRKKVITKETSLLVRSGSGGSQIDIR
jgi:hypothetical protein